MHRCAVRHDGRYGHAYVPGIHLRVPHERGAYFLRTNSAGFRADHEFGPRNGKPRIVVFGDSFAAGDGVSNAERFTDLLANHLDADVQNMAISGSGPDQQLLLLEDHPPVDADLVLWCLAVHTIERIQSAHRLTIDRYGRLVRIPRPRFVLQGDQLVLEGTPVPEQGEPVAGAAEVLPPPLEHPVRRATRRTLASALARCRRLAVSTVDRFGGLERASDYADGEGEAWALMSAIVRRFHRGCGGVPVVLVPLPTKPYLSGGARPTFQARFESLARPDAGLHVLDVVSELRSAPLARRESYTYARDRHYSAAGHAALTSIASRRLVADGHVRAADRRSDFDGRANGAEGATSGAVLVIAWTARESTARLLHDGALVTSADEGGLAGDLGHAGALPFAAINHCMEAGGLVGPELDGIVLESPGPLGDALDDCASDPAILAPWVRWIGAAERDVRALLRFEGNVEHVAGVAASEASASAESADDEEQRWLRAQVARISRRGRPSDADVRRLATRWERATRRARDAARP